MSVDQRRRSRDERYASGAHLLRFRFAAVLDDVVRALDRFRPIYLRLTDLDAEFVQAP
jgi:hypothetical protein